MMNEHCPICGHVLSEPEDGPIYCWPCKDAYPGRTRSGIDTELQEDHNIINPNIPRIDE